MFAPMLTPVVQTVVSMLDFSWALGWWNGGGIGCTGAPATPHSHVMNLWKDLGVLLRLPKSYAEIFRSG